MKYISLKHKILALTFVFISVVGQAQAVNDVTLVVSSDGATKEEATKNALRSAIEQAYGTFVSANTTILNDVLVQEEIVTIAGGNIKSYKELSSTEMPDGSRFVTLQATVSVSNLISYARSKGAVTEFDGATFGMNLKLKQLNKENELKVMDNLFTQLEVMAPTIYDYELKMSEPRIDGNFAKIDATIIVKSNGNTENFYNLLINTLTAISMSEQEAVAAQQYGFDFWTYCVKEGNAPQDFSGVSYCFPIADMNLSQEEEEFSYLEEIYNKKSQDKVSRLYRKWHFYNEWQNKRFIKLWFSVLFPSLKDNTGQVYSLIEDRYLYNDSYERYKVEDALLSVGMDADFFSGFGFSQKIGRKYGFNVKGVRQGTVGCLRIEERWGPRRDCRLDDNLYLKSLRNEIFYDGKSVTYNLYDHYCKVYKPRLYFLVFQSDDSGVAQYEIGCTINIPLNKLTQIKGFEIIRDYNFLKLVENE